MNNSEGGAASQIRAFLQRLEMQLMDPQFRKEREKVEKLLAEDFREFGSSGRIWSRAQILDLLANETPQAAPAVEDFAVQLLTPEVALITYKAVHKDTGAATLRSSIWDIRDGNCRIVFHQGTKIPR